MTTVAHTRIVPESLEDTYKKIKAGFDALALSSA
jgi:hypothetical protein